MIKRITLLAVMALVLTAFPIMGVGAHDDVSHPALTPETLDLGVLTAGIGADFVVVDKTVHTPEIPPAVDVCLLEDETGSFFDDIANLQNPATIAAIFNGITTGDKQFAVSGFRDYPVAPHGGGGDHVYRSLSTMSPLFANWQNGVNGLSAGGGADGPEAQYDAIVASLGPGTFPDPTRGDQDPCGFRYPNPLVTHVLVVTTDAPFHLPGGGKPHVNDLASTTLALNNAGGGKGVVVIGLTAPGSGPELGWLAGNTGGSTQPLSSNGANIAQAIIDGIKDIDIDVSMASNCAAKTDGVITTAFAPAVQTVTSGDDAVFTETISVAEDAEPGVYQCQDWALINGEPMTDRAGEIIFEEKWITVAYPFCEEGVNPDGETPQAPGTGQNEDGFYRIGAWPEDAGLEVELVDNGTGTVFGPFPTPTNIKYTEANGANPSIKPGPGAVDWRIKGQGDAFVLFTDDFGNMARAACFVPPPPK